MNKRGGFNFTPKTGSFSTAKLADFLWIIQLGQSMISSTAAADWFISWNLSMKNGWFRGPMTMATMETLNVFHWSAREAGQKHTCFFPKSWWIPCVKKHWGLFSDSPIKFYKKIWGKLAYFADLKLAAAFTDDSPNPSRMIPKFSHHAFSRAVEHHQEHLQLSYVDIHIYHTSSCYLPPLAPRVFPLCSPMKTYWNHDDILWHFWRLGNSVLSSQRLPIE